MIKTNSSGQLRVLCFGMGAVGTYIGASLASAGAEVVFIEKNQATSSKGSCEICLSLQTREIVIPDQRVIFDLEELNGEKPFDIAILAVKSFDTVGVIDRIKQTNVDFPPILCMQNGVENEDLLIEAFGKLKVISGTLTSAITRSNLGVVKLEKLRGVGIEAGHPLSEKLVDWFNASGLNAKGYSSRLSMKWSKMLTNLLTNASAAILNWTPKQVFSNPLTFHLEVEQIRETLAVMNAMNIQVTDLPGTPVKVLIAILNRFPEAITRKLVGVPLAKARGDKMPSFHIDLYAGKKTSEVSYLNGAVVRFGKKMGIRTPVNQVFTETLEKLSAGEINTVQYMNHPEKLAKLVEEST
jgi:2-dehydropantoate 2-reductase